MGRRAFGLRSMVLGLSVLMACRADNLEPSLPKSPTTPRPHFLITHYDTLYPSADTWIRSAPKWQTQTGSDSLRTKDVVGNTDTNRTVIRFDQSAIAAQVGSRTLVSAVLQMTVKASGSYSAGSDVAIHRMTMGWVEDSATWKCGSDLDITNMYHDCTTTAWAMSGSGAIPYDTTATTQLHLTAGQTGLIQFDVTPDVAAFLGGTTNYGWLLKLVDESRDQRVSYWSREAATGQPQLILTTTEPDTTPPPPVDSILYPVADNWIRAAPKWQTQGASDSLRTKTTTTGTDTNRTVIRFDQSAIAAYVAGRTLTSATLELTVKASGSYSQGNDVGAYRMTMGWAEDSVTWKCGSDLDITNMYHDCTTTAWAMSGTGTVPYVTTPTAQVHLNGGQTGTVQLDVTADVQAFLNGTTNQGWLLKLVDEGRDQRVSYWSREAATGRPRLILTVSQVDSAHLLAVVDSGVSGSPQTVDSFYAIGDTVTYSYTAASGFDSPIVMLDGQLVSSSGKIAMDAPHLLVASTKPTVTLSTAADNLRLNAHDLLTAADPVAAFQSHLDGVASYLSSVSSDEGERQLSTAYGLAFDPIADSAALRTLDDALANHVFHVANPYVGPPSDSIEKVHLFYVNGIHTSPVEAADTRVKLFGLVTSDSYLKTRVDTVSLFYNRTRTATPESEELTVARCLNLARYYSVVLFRDKFNQCVGHPHSVAQSDLAESLWQLFNIANGWTYFTQDAQALADSIQQYRNRSRHVIVVAHSQGNLLLNQADHLLTDGGYIGSPDTVGFAAVALASPTNDSFVYPLDTHHLIHIVVAGDLIPSLGAFAGIPNNTPPINTPMSQAAAAHQVAIIDTLNAYAVAEPSLSSVAGLFSVYRQLQSGFGELHDVNKAYLGQTIVADSILRSIAALYREVTVDSVKGSSTIKTAVGWSTSATAQVLNGNHRPLVGRKLSWRSADSTIATVDSIGKVTGVTAGTTTVTAQSWKHKATFTAVIDSASLYGNKVIIARWIRQPSWGCYDTLYIGDFTADLVSNCGGGNRYTTTFAAVTNPPFVTTQLYPFNSILYRWDMALAGDGDILVGNYFGLPNGVPTVPLESFTRVP